MRYTVVFLLILLSSCAAGIDATTGASSNEATDFDVKVNTSSSSFSLSSEKYQAQLSFPNVFPDKELKGDRFSVEVK